MGIRKESLGKLLAVCVAVCPSGCTLDTREPTIVQRVHVAGPKPTPVQPFRLIKTVKDVNEKISSELPFGTPRYEIEAFLKANKWGHFYSTDRLHSDDYHTEQAETPESVGEGSNNINIVFRFDDEDRLSQYSIYLTPTESWDLL